MSMIKKGPAKIYFLKLLLPAISAFFIAVTGLFIFNDYYVNKQSRMSSQRVIFKAFMSSIRQPLIQGSFLEARIRAEELLKYPEIACVEIKAEQTNLLNCTKDLSSLSSVNMIEEVLTFSPENS